MPAMPHLLLIGSDPAALDAWRRGLADAGVQIAGALSPLEAPLRLRAMRPSLLVLLDPWGGDEARQTLERCRAAAESALPAILVLWSSPWLRTPLPLDFSPATMSPPIDSLLGHSPSIPPSDACADRPAMSS